MALFGKKIQTEARNLREAIIMAICTCQGRDIELQFHSRIAAFLSERFTSAKSRNPDCDALLNELLKECTEG